jgi:hypothetical protein
MKSLSIPFTFVINLLLLINNSQAQILTKCTTAELLKKAFDSGFQGNYPSEELNDAIPLIDTMTAVALTRIGDARSNSFFKYAISLQCHDDSLKQQIINNLLAYDQLCNNGVLIAKNDYNRFTSGYEYGPFRNGLLSQIEKNDTNFLSIAKREFEFWAPFEDEYKSVVSKPGRAQMSMGKRKFNPCTLAGPANCSLWATCIYYLTGDENYKSPNEKLNESYKRMISGSKRRIERRKDFIRFGKEETITADTAINSFDALDFETIPELKDKFNKLNKNDGSWAAIYTNGSKALLYMVYSDKMTVGFSKHLMVFPTLYFMQIKMRGTIQLTKINYRERYLLE